MGMLCVLFHVHIFTAERAWLAHIVYTFKVFEITDSTTSYFMKHTVLYEAYSTLYTILPMAKQCKAACHDCLIDNFTNDFIADFAYKHNLQAFIN